MQMEQKDIGAIKLKVISSIILLILVVKIGYAQTDDFAFQKSFMRTFKYPSSLREACTPTFTNLLFEISNKGELINIKLSDSAPIFFAKDFIAFKKNLDLNPIKNTIKTLKLKNCNIIIPIFYVYGSDYCVNTFEPFGNLSNNYLSFEGKTSSKMSFLMKPIFVTLNKPIY